MRERGLAEIGRREQIGRPQILGEDDELRPDTADTMPPVITQDTALGRKRSLAVSAAAKR